MKRATNFDVLADVNVSVEPSLFRVSAERPAPTLIRGNSLKIAIIAPFFDNTNIGNAPWIDYFLDPVDNLEFRHVHRKRPMPKWHDRKSELTVLPEWLQYLQQALGAFRGKPDMVVSVFPQLAASAGLLKRFSSNTKVMAWMFNVGTCHDGWRRKLAQLSLAKVDLFVVHTRREIKIYSEWLNLPEDRFVFVPYQSKEIPVTFEEDTDAPFVAAMGSAHRDYNLFARAIGDLNLPTVIASSKAAVAGIDLPDCIETPFGISKEKCLELTQRARVNVIPLLPKPAVTAAGQVTLVEAMFMGKVLVATEYYGIEDYVEHEKTGLLVQPNDYEGLRDAIKRLWDDRDLREELAANAQAHARSHFSDEAAAQSLKSNIEMLALTGTRSQTT